MSTVLYEPAFAVVTAWFERQRTRALTALTLLAGLASTIFMPRSSATIPTWPNSQTRNGVSLATQAVTPAHEEAPHRGAHDAPPLGRPAVRPWTAPPPQRPPRSRRTPEANR